MYNKGLVSILMNCYNGDKYLDEAVQSIVKQSYTNWELVFIDNHSVDKSREIIQSYNDDNRIKYHKTPEHMPLGEAREFGLKKCNGEFICFLDTDDIWLDNKLETQICLFESNPQAIITYSSFHFIDEKGRVTGKWQVKNKKGFLFGDNLENYQINFQTVMLKAEALKIIDKPYFNPMLKFSPDYNLMMRTLANGEAISNDKILVHYRKTANSLTGKTIEYWGIEAEYTYNQLAELGYVKRYASKRQKERALGKINYYKALYSISKKDFKSARSLLKQYRKASFKYLFLHYLSYLPWVWDFVHAKRR